MKKNAFNSIVASIAVLVSLLTVVFAAVNPDWRYQFSASGYYTYGTPIVSASDGSHTDKIEINWTNVWGAQHYQLFRCTTDKNQSCGSLLATTVNTNFDDTEAVPGSLHYYRVEVVFSGSYSSDFSEAESGYRSLLPPASVSATDGLYIDRVQISWSQSSGATAYGVYRCTSAEIDSCTAIGTTINESFIDSSAPIGELNYYRITPITSAGPGVLSDSDSGYRSLPPPVSVSASDGLYLGEVEIHWSTVVDATGYGISRCDTEEIDTCFSIGTTIGTYFGDSGVAPGAHHYYRVKSRGSAGNEGVLSEPDEGYRALDLAGVRPQGISASSDKKDMVTVSWGLVSGASSYDIYRSESGNQGTAQNIGREDDPAISHDDVSAVPEALYFYWVKALNPASESDFSEAVTGVRVIDLSAGNPPMDVEASDGEFPDKINVSWTAVHGATKYELYRSRSSDVSSASKVANVADPVITYDDFSVQSGDAFYYWVKAVNVDSESGFSLSDRGYVEGCTFS